MRKIQDADVVGKTVKSVENESVNVITLTFTDGTSLELWAEQAVYTPMGSIPGIFVDDSTPQEG